MKKTDEIQHVSIDPENKENKHRIDTGGIQFDDDWPGFFIRGDGCMGICMSLNTVCSLLLDDKGRLIDYSELSDAGRGMVEWALYSLMLWGIDMEDEAILNSKTKMFEKIRKIQKEVEEATKDELG